MGDNSHLSDNGGFRYNKLEDSILNLLYVLHKSPWQVTDKDKTDISIGHFLKELVNFNKEFKIFQ